MNITFTEGAESEGIPAALLLTAIGRTVKVTKNRGIAMITGEIVGLNLRDWELQVREYGRYVASQVLTWPIPIREIVEVEFQ